MGNSARINFLVEDVMRKFFALISAAFSGYNTSWPKLPQENFGDTFFAPQKPNGTTVLAATAS